jgi:hypothetical protein
MKVHYKVSEEYRVVFRPPFLLAEIAGVVIIIGGLFAHAFFG